MEKPENKPRENVSRKEIVTDNQIFDGYNINYSYEANKDQKVYSVSVYANSTDPGSLNATLSKDSTSINFNGMDYNSDLVAEITKECKVILAK